MSFNISTYSHRYIPQENCLINNSNSRIIFPPPFVMWLPFSYHCCIIVLIDMRSVRLVFFSAESTLWLKRLRSYNVLIYSTLRSTYKRKLEWNAAPIYERCQNESDLTINFLITFFCHFIFRHQIVPMTKTATNHIFNFIFFFFMFCVLVWVQKCHCCSKFSLNPSQPEQRLREKYIQIDCKTENKCENETNKWWTLNIVKMIDIRQDYLLANNGKWGNSI